MLILNRKHRAGLPAQIHLSDTHEMAPLAADIALAKTVTERLMSCYPGHPWMVWATHEQGIVNIKLPNLTDKTGVVPLGRNWGMVVHINRLKGDPAMKAVVKAGGELLERWNIRRGAYDPAQYRDSAPAFNDKQIAKKVLVDAAGAPLKA